MQERAAFSIQSYAFDKVIIDLENQKSDDLSLAFETKGTYLKDNANFELTFEVRVFNEETANEPFIYVRCIGLFDFKNVSSFEEIPNFFYRNSIAILFPYLRAYISLVTTQANTKGIVLPTLNLSSLEDELRSNTTQL